MVSHKGANELLLRHLPEPPSFQERIIGPVQAYTAGYDHDVDLISHLAAAPGVQLTVYSTPDSLRAALSRLFVPGGSVKYDDVRAQVTTILHPCRREDFLL